MECAIDVVMEKVFVWLATIHGGINQIWFESLFRMLCGVQLANCEEARLRRANDIASFDLAPRQKPCRPPIK